MNESEGCAVFLPFNSSYLVVCLYVLEGRLDAMQCIYAVLVGTIYDRDELLPKTMLKT